MDDLSGKRALVTGGARRLGRAVCLALGAAGANVAVHYHSSADEADALVAELTALGVGAVALAADLSDPEQALALFAQARDGGRIDILVNSASVFPQDSLHDVSTDGLLRNVQVNAWSPFLLARELAGQGDAGNVVNLLDAKIVQYDREHLAYHLGKRMLFSLTRMMAVEFAPAVRVNAVAPGLILPPPGKDEAYLRRTASQNPLQTWGSAGQIAAAVLFLLRSPFITGQVIFVDGGQHMRGSMYGA